MKKKISLLILFVAFLMVSAINAQSNCDEIFVPSWKIGNETISSEQKFDLTLSSDNKEFQSYVVADSGKSIELLVNYLPVSKEKLSETGKPTESWKVELREVHIDKNEFLGNDLIKNIGVRGGDYFPREDLVGYIYLKDRSPIKAGNYFLIDGSFYYPPKSKRIIKVEDFYVVIQVNDFQLNSLDKHK